MTDLGVPSGEYYSVADGINAEAQVVGYFGNSSGTTHAFLYSNGAMTDLGTLPGGTSSQATGINNAGQVVGYSTTASGATHAFLYSNGAMTDLGTLPGGTSSFAYGINAEGQVAGYSDSSSGTHAFLGKAGSALTVARSGTGSGAVASSPSGINCGASCSAVFSQETVVTLTADANFGSYFAGWSGGGCSGIDPCSVTMSGDVTVGAEFISLNPCAYTLSLSSKKTFPANGGSAGVTVKATGAAACAEPDLVASDSWITAAFTSAGWKNNKGTAAIAIAKNGTSSERTGSVVFAIDKATFKITQKPVLCSVIKLVPGSESFSAAEGSGSFTLALSADDCAWTAASSADWITSDNGGTGSATVHYSVAANDTKRARTGKITVTLTADGKKKAYVVKQKK